MKLKNCELNVKAVMTAPLIRTGPSAPWEQSFKNNLIPKSLYEFYNNANCFSFEKCPKFLKDNNNIIFAHVEAATELIRDSFSEYEEIIDYMRTFDAKCYNPIKHSGRSKTREQIIAENNFKRHLQQLLISMYSILDSTSEIITAVLSWGDIGRAKFSWLVSESEKKSSLTSKIVGLNDSFIVRIKEIIREEILEASGSSKDWYKLFKLYRNKLAHFKLSGILMFHDNKSDFYRFLPRVWPNYIQQHVKYTVDGANCQDEAMFILSLSMEEDIFDYLLGAREKLSNLTNRLFAIIIDAYTLKKDAKCDIESDVECQANELLKIYDFKHF